MSVSALTTVEVQTCVKDRDRESFGEKRTVLRAVSQLCLGTLEILMESGQRLAGSLMAWRQDRDVVNDHYLTVCVFMCLKTAHMSYICVSACICMHWSATMHVRNAYMCTIHVYVLVLLQLHTRLITAEWEQHECVFQNKLFCVSIYLYSTTRKNSVFFFFFM